MSENKCCEKLREALFQLSPSQIWDWARMHFTRENYPITDCLTEARDRLVKIRNEALAQPNQPAIAGSEEWTMVNCALIDAVPVCDIAIGEDVIAHRLTEHEARLLIKYHNAALRRQSAPAECKTELYSSRVCEKGTRCCVVYHSEPAPPTLDQRRIHNQARDLCRLQSAITGCAVGAPGWSATIDQLCDRVEEMRKSAPTVEAWRDGILVELLDFVKGNGDRPPTLWGVEEMLQAEMDRKVSASASKEET